MYQRAIEGVGLILETAWNKFNDPKVPEKQKLGYLHLAKGCHESMFNFAANGVSVLALKNIIERANRLGIDHTPLEEERRPLLSSNNTPFVWETQTKETATETKDNDNLDAQQ